MQNTTTEKARLVETKEPVTARATLWAVSGICGKKITEKLRTKMQTRRERFAAMKLFKEANEQRRKKSVPEVTFPEWMLFRFLELKLTKADGEVSREEKRATAELLKHMEHALLERQILKDMQSDSPF